MEAPKEYFNLYVEYQNTESTEEEIYNTFAYTVLDTDELNQYIDLVKRKSWGEHAIGNHNLQVVPAHTIKIFDLSNVVHIGDVYSREELLKMVPVVPWTKIPLLEQLEKYGADVTKELFGEELELFLDRLQLEIQIEQRGINAETGELGSLFSEGNIKGQVKGGSSVEGKLSDGISQIFPKNFDHGILDSSVEPAFNVEKIASVFANHLKNLKHENGQMIGVFGKWGRGKTYFINQVLQQIQVESNGEETPTYKNKWSRYYALFIKSNFNPFKLFYENEETKDGGHFKLIEFQAWKYQNTPSIWAYLYETFINEYLAVDGKEKVKRILKLNRNRNGNWSNWWWPIIAIAIGLVWFFVIPFKDKIDGMLQLSKWAGGIGAVLIIAYKIIAFTKLFKKPAIKIFDTISKIPSFNNVLGVQAEIQKELVYLIQTWSKIIKDKRILLFIDDLDRCSENELMGIIDSLRVMLDDEKINKHLLVLVALDASKLTAAINEKYDTLTEKGGNSELAKEYFDKLFISAIKLGTISSNERVEFIKKLASQINDLINPPQSTPAALLFEQKHEGKTYSAPETQKSTKNLEPIEISLLEEKVKLSKKEMTPRQIRILIYRYLLARNLWLVFYGILDWKADNAIDEIMRFSKLNGDATKAVTKVNGDLSIIAQMVVAY